MKQWVRLAAVAVICIAGITQVAAEDGVHPEDRIRSQLRQAVPGIAITSIEPSPLKGIYMVETSNRQLLYASEDGRFIFSGDMYQIDGTKIANMTELRREAYRKKLVTAVAEEDMVVFRPQGDVKGKVYVFTDVDCGYCRKLHREVPRMNELGIQVNYLAYPRAGVGSDSYNKMVSVWCAEDRQAAMTVAKQGGRPESRVCDNPVAEEFELGNRIGVTGTPAIVLESGRLLPGYVPADNLARTLGLLTP